MTGHDESRSGPRTWHGRKRYPRSYHGNGREHLHGKSGEILLLHLLHHHRLTILCFIWIEECVIGTWWVGGNGVCTIWRRGDNTTTTTTAVRIQKSPYVNSRMGELEYNIERACRGERRRVQRSRGGPNCFNVKWDYLLYPPFLHMKNSSRYSLSLHFCIWNIHSPFQPDSLSLHFCIWKPIGIICAELIRNDSQKVSWYPFSVFSSVKIRISPDNEDF